MRRWTLHFTVRSLPEPSRRHPALAALSTDLAGWIDQANVPDGAPFLVAPDFSYDLALNAWFVSTEMRLAAANTRNGYARDLSAFLTFLAHARGGRDWRDATEEDHLAYLHWRHHDPAGPRIAGSTWNREVAAVSKFFRWAQWAGHCPRQPIPHRLASAPPAGLRAYRRGQEVAATYSHDARRDRIQWLTPSTYRTWRDVGLRGYSLSGLSDPGFRGRWAARNAAFADLMVRTGMRLSEQASIMVAELPLLSGPERYQRFWLAPAIAKRASARWIYIPATVISDLAAYASCDRARVIADARARGRYNALRDVLAPVLPHRHRWESAASHHPDEDHHPVWE